MDDEHIDEMLFGASSLDRSPQESLTSAGQFVWETGNNTKSSTPSTSPSPSISQKGIASISSLHTSADRVSADKSVDVAPSSSEPDVDKHGTSSSTDSSSSLHARHRDRQWVIERIEDIFEQLTDALLKKKGSLSITMRSRSCMSSHPRLPSHHIVEGAVTAAETKYHTVRFPGKTADEAWRFTSLVKVLELIHEAIVNNVIITKRDIYYRHPALFVKQSLVDRYVDDVACTFGVPRSLLNVSAAAKGLVAGTFTIRRDDGSEVDGLADREGILVPKLRDTDVIHMPFVEWILIIEKEATFRSLAASNFWSSLSASGIMVTAKGYPDIATRSFLRKLITSSTQNGIEGPSIYALVDFDPDGLDIVSTYKYGSVSLAHENVALNIPTLCWVGIRSSQIISHDEMHDGQGLLRLTPRDRRKATLMLGRATLAEDGPEPEWRREVQVMLMLNIKAEIQLAEGRSGGLAEWLVSELIGH